MNLHPALQILSWCVLVAVLQRLAWLPLCAVAGLLLVAGAWLAGKKFWQLLRRTRWIMFSLLLIYAYSTPGEAWFGSLGMWSPVREGVIDGVTQLLRLLAALASLAMLLDRLHRLELISGLYSLFAPLKCLGVSRERCAIRLALTLHYAEIAMLRSATRWQDALQGLFDAHGEVAQPICLPVHQIRLRDALVGVVLAVCVLGLICT